MYIASLIVTAKKWIQVTFPTIVNLLNRIYYNSIKDSHRVIKNEALKECLWIESNVYDKQKNKQMIKYYLSMIQFLG